MLSKEEKLKRKIDKQMEYKLKKETIDNAKISGREISR